MSIPTRPNTRPGAPRWWCRSRRTHVAVGMILVALASCRGDAAPDAPVVPPRDAEVEPDALGWTCEPDRPAPPPATADSPSVVFDTSLPVLEAADGMLATFIGDDGIVVATSRQLHFLTLGGELERSVPFVLEDATHVEVHHIVVGDKGFGAVVFAVVDGGVEDRFCLVDPTAGLVAESCTDLDGGPVSPRFALTFDSARFAVFSPQRLSSFRRSRIDIRTAG